MGSFFKETKKKIRGNRHAISKVVFSPDGNTLAAVDQKNGLYLWNVFTGALKMDFNNSSTHISEILFSLDGQSLLSWDYQGLFTAWDVSTGKHKTVNTNHTSVFSQKLFSPDGKSFAVATCEFTKEHRMIYQLELWDAVVGNLKHRLIGHTDQVLSFCFSPTGRHLPVVARIKRSDCGMLTQENRFIY